MTDTAPDAADLFGLSDAAHDIMDDTGATSIVIIAHCPERGLGFIVSDPNGELNVPRVLRFIARHLVQEEIAEHHRDCPSAVGDAKRTVN